MTKNAACVNGTIEITLELIQYNIRGEFAMSKLWQIRIMCVKAQTFKMYMHSHNLSAHLWYKLQQLSRLLKEYHICSREII